MSSMSSQFEDERWLIFTLDQRHRDAFIAEQIRLRRAGQPSPIVSAWTSLRASIGTIFNTATTRVRRHPIASPEFAAEPASLQDLTDEPANAPVTA
jgi:hypothetical protein